MTMTATTHVAGEPHELSNAPKIELTFDGTTTTIMTPNPSHRTLTRAFRDRMRLRRRVRRGAATITGLSSVRPDAVLECGFDAVHSVRHLHRSWAVGGPTVRYNRRSVALAAGLVVTSLIACSAAGAFRASADPTAYLINVTVRPGYNFANAADALAYGHRICDDIEGGHSYAQLTAAVMADFQTSDDFQASYLISQAANELCPALIWQLRNSAAHDWPRQP